MDLSYLVESEGFSIAEMESPPRLYFYMKHFDWAEVENLRNAIHELAGKIDQSVLIFDYFDFDLEDPDVSLQNARDALVEVGVRNVYRVGPLERLCKVINSLDYEDKYSAYFTLSYGELDNLLRMLNR